MPIDPLTLNLMFLFVVAMAAWFPCCNPYDPPPCGSCSADSDTVSVTFTGAVDGACDCDWINATFILSRLSGNACAWRTQGTFACGVGGSYTITAEATDIPPGSPVRKGWRVTLGIAIPAGGISNIITYQWRSASSTSFDCTATQSLTLLSAASVPALCDTTAWSSSTCTVN